MSIKDLSLTAAHLPEKKNYGKLVKSRKKIKSRIKMWYIDPIRKMSDHEAFIALAICFLLYEKYLRANGKIKENENFSEGHRVFEVIGKDLGVNKGCAYKFWSYWRNGLLHKAMPKVDDPYVNYIMDPGLKVPIEEIEKELYVNPWKVRDKILKVMLKDEKMWSDALYPFAEEFIVKGT